jgi:CRISPR-associated protein Csx3
MYDRYPVLPNPFPAVIIGGFSHSGKSVLCNSLTQALRAANIAHYLLRAAPDGEGDWSYLASEATVRLLRVKGRWTPEWVDQMCNAIAVRHMPLLVDMGGHPTPEQERIYDQCTHAIIVTRNDQEREHWHALVTRHALSLLADLRSDLNGINSLSPEVATEPISGVVTGLHRHGHANGPAFAAVVHRLKPLLSSETERVVNHARSLAPWSPHEDVAFVDFDDMLAQRGAARFSASDIASVPGALPETRLALYGRAPLTLVCAIAARRVVEWVFHPAYGWLRVPIAKLGAPSHDQGLNYEIESDAIRHRLRVVIDHGWLDVHTIRNIVVPQPGPPNAVELYGRLPMWLVAALTRAYTSDGFSVSVFDPVERSNR